jgi:hypothetical protein
MAYDLMGDGKTALKVSIGKYVLGQAGFGGNGLSTNGPAQGVVQTTTRTWNDSFFGPGDPRTGNFFPDCDISNPLQNGECGQYTNLAFGSALPVAAVDDDVRYGWGKRQYDWEFSVSAQREVTRNVSVYGGYFRRWYGNFYVTDNRAVTAADYQQYALTAPTAATVPAAGLLPGGGGYPVTGLFLINQDAFSRIPDNFTTFSDNFGKQIDHWNGFDLGANVRAANGFILQGGLSIGHQLLDNCEVAAQLPETLFQSIDFFGTLNWQPLSTCRVEYPWLGQYKFLGGYTLPKVDVQIGATFQSIPGFERLGAIWQAPNTLVASAIGRSVPGSVNNAGTTAINVVNPGQIYGDRLKQLDLRFGKVLRFARTRSIVSADIFNVTNSSTVSNESRNLLNWQQPISIIGARLLRVSWQFDF